MATWPQTEADIIARLDTIETELQKYETAPEKFSVLTGGSVLVDPEKLVLRLERERDHLLGRLDQIPYFRGSIPEQIV